MFDNTTSSYLLMKRRCLPPMETFTVPPKLGTGASPVTSLHQTLFPGPFKSMGGRWSGRDTGAATYSARAPLCPASRTPRRALQTWRLTKQAHKAEYTHIGEAASSGPPSPDAGWGWGRRARLCAGIGGWETGGMDAVTCGETVDSQGST